MNFGERLKQLRTEKGLTQPQFAQVAGIEQSYLSKLENDKSVPSAEMFTTMLAGLGKISSGLSLTFDRFREDQALQLMNNDSAEQQMTGIRIDDVPNSRSHRWMTSGASARRAASCRTPSSVLIGRSCPMAGA
ncbi:MAG: helix-turn-helix domain-containing protein [Telluria sp.]